jgi:hypothetical protein
VLVPDTMRADATDAIIELVGKELAPGAAG